MKRGWEKDRAHTDFEVFVGWLSSNVVGISVGAFEGSCCRELTSINLSWNGSGLGEGREEGDNGGDVQSLHLEGDDWSNVTERCFGLDERSL